MHGLQLDPKQPLTNPSEVYQRIPNHQEREVIDFYSEHSINHDNVIDVKKMNRIYNYSGKDIAISSTDIGPWSQIENNNEVEIPQSIIKNKLGSSVQKVPLPCNNFNRNEKLNESFLLNKNYSYTKGIQQKDQVQRNQLIQLNQMQNYLNMLKIMKEKINTDYQNTLSSNKLSLSYDENNLNLNDASNGTQMTINQQNNEKNQQKFQTIYGSIVYQNKKLPYEQVKQQFESHKVGLVNHDYQETANNYLFDQFKSTMSQKRTLVDNRMIKNYRFIDSRNLDTTFNHNKQNKEQNIKLEVIQYKQQNHSFSQKYIDQFADNGNNTQNTRSQELIDERTKYKPTLINYLKQTYNTNFLIKNPLYITNSQEIRSFSMTQMNSNTGILDNDIEDYSSFIPVQIEKIRNLRLPVPLIGQNGKQIDPSYSLQKNQLSDPLLESNFYTKQSFVYEDPYKEKNSFENSSTRQSLQYNNFTLKKILDSEKNIRKIKNDIKEQIGIQIREHQRQEQPIFQKRSQHNSIDKFLEQKIKERMQNLDNNVIQKNQGLSQTSNNNYNNNVNRVQSYIS